MLIARGHAGNVLASGVEKEAGQKNGPACQEAVLLKKGRIKVHHFSHIPPSDCAYGRGESDEHRQAKLEIYQALERHPQVTDLQLERYLGDVRPDVSFSLSGRTVAIEVQISSLSLDTIDRRTKSYARKGISLLWVSPYHPNMIHDERYAPRIWEKYLHALYFGKVYYWTSGEVLQPVKFDEYRLWVEYSSWYDADGNECGAGGYYRYSKRYRTPRLLPRVRITELATVNRKPWSSSEISVPAARLWCEPYQTLPKPIREVQEPTGRIRFVYCDGCSTPLQVCEKAYIPYRNGKVCLWVDESAESRIKASGHEPEDGERFFDCTYCRDCYNSHQDEYSTAS